MQEKPSRHVHSYRSLSMILRPFLLIHVLVVMNASKTALHNSMSMTKLFGRQVFVKRDDLQFKYGEGLSGNKGRKFRSLLTSSEQHSHLVSYGGAQSNTLLALSQIAASRKCSLHYYTQTIPTRLKVKPIGNHLQAIRLGTQMVEVSNQAYSAIRSWSEAGASMVDFKSVFGPVLPDTVREEAVQWVPQGGSMPSAQDGVYGLGEELLEFTASAGLQGPWKVVVASGTGTTAYFLARFFAHCSGTTDIQVLAVPCVGTANYLLAQMEALDRQCGSTGVFPTIVQTNTAPKRTFAKPTREHMAISKSLHRQSGIEFDLIYAPRAWEVLLGSASPDKATVSAINADKPLLRDWAPDANIIYYHCGGVEGNPSQLSRYQYLGLD